MHDFSTPFIVFSMLCGAVISIRLGLLQGHGGQVRQSDIWEPLLVELVPDG
jgi:hypothetical protein